MLGPSVQMQTEQVREVSYFKSTYVVSSQDSSDLNENGGNAKATSTQGSPFVFSLLQRDATIDDQLFIAF
jgi:hypothetical protein